MSPIFLEDMVTKEKLWKNPVPGSSKYLWPLGHTTEKDGEAMMVEWVKKHKDEISNLYDINLNIDEKDITVKFKVFPSMMDGKMRKAVNTAVLRESASIGLKLKSHGNRTKLNYQTCWVSFIVPVP
jgi:hypothetical protein